MDDDSMIPPEGTMVRGTYGASREEFIAVGTRFLAHFVELAGLRQDADVLDVGCGCGRMAVPLTRHLSQEGSYAGFDLIPKGIAWCQNQIAPHFPNFAFFLADIHNDRYNPQGTIQAAQYRFPFAADTFDFVILTSVFTHMRPDAVEHYLAEIARTLRPGGKVFATYFLLNESSEQLIRSGMARRNRDFPHDFGAYRSISEEMPEKAIAYREEFVRGLYERHGLWIGDPIYYGNWSGRQPTLGVLHNQDYVIAEKPASGH